MASTVLFHAKLALVSLGLVVTPTGCMCQRGDHGSKPLRDCGDLIGAAHAVLASTPPVLARCVDAGHGTVCSLRDATSIRMVNYAPGVDELQEVALFWSAPSQTAGCACSMIVARTLKPLFGDPETFSRCEETPYGDLRWCDNDKAISLGVYAGEDDRGPFSVGVRISLPARDAIRDFPLCAHHYNKVPSGLAP